MISATNQPREIANNDADFTVAHYRELLRLAHRNWPLASYDTIPFGQRFILWRHDCDYSLNRALALARIESDEGIRSTYFVNPHCEFYHLLEHSQVKVVRQILEMGHSIALHFDGMFYTTRDESELVFQLESEARLLEDAFGVKPTAFSFHNPSMFHLSCENDQYAGMVNTYSRRFKTEVAYCSDSNGYWRFRRLFNVLEQATDTCLQVLTHPGWWQDVPMTPRQRVFRSVYGRAEATIDFFDKAIEAGGRRNPAGARDTLKFLRMSNHKDYPLFDYLFHCDHFAVLFLALFQLHGLQMHRLCKAHLRKEWHVPVRELNVFFEANTLAIDGWKLFVGVFKQSWHYLSGAGVDIYSEWIDLRNQLAQGCGNATNQRLEGGCVFLCGAIASLADWGQAQPIGYDGLGQLDTIGLPTYKTADGAPTDRLEEIPDEIPNCLRKRWNELKAEMNVIGVGRASTSTAKFVT